MVADYPKVLNRVLTAALLLWSTAAWAQVSWPNEPAGSTVLSDCDMSVAPCPEWFPGSNPGSVVSDASATFSPPSVTAFTYNPSTGIGGGEPFFSFPVSGLNEVYVGAYLWIDNNFYFRNTGHEKVFYLGDFAGGNMWTELYAGAFNGTGNAVMSTVYQPGDFTSNCHLDNIVNADCPTGGSVTFAYGGPTFTRGTYHRLEVYHKRSSSSTSQDGILRMWLDGTQVVNETRFNHRSNSPFGFILITQAWDGSDPGLPNANQWRYDHIRVSSPNCGAQGCPQPTPNWPNQPTGASTLLDWAFNTVAGSGLTDASGRGTIVSDATAQLSPVNVLRSRLQNGIAPGGVTLQYDLADLSEVFAGAWWKPNTTFQGDSNSLNHMMWFQKSGTPAAVGRVTWFGTSNAAGLSGSIQFHINDVDSSFNNCHLTGWVGNCPGPGRLTPNMSSCTVAATDDQWHRLEVYVRRSTSTTNRSGIVRWWLDGNLCGNYDPQAGTGVNWGPAGFDYWAWNEEWTTTPITQSADWIHYIDHLYISQPTGATTVDTMPPGPVTNFGVTTGGPPPPDPPPVGVSPGAEWFQFF